MSAVVVKSCNKLWENLAGERGASGETFVVGYLVELSEASNMGPRLARAAVGIKRGDAFKDTFPDEVDANDGSGMVCDSVNASVRANAPWLWDVTAKFAVPTAASGGGSYVVNPLTRPPSYEWSVSEEQYVPTVDKSPSSTPGGVKGKKVMNSLGEPFDPPPTALRAQPLLRVRKNMLRKDVNPTWIVGIVDRVNSDTFYGATPGQARIKGVTASESSENGVDFMTVTIEIAFIEEGWNQTKIRNRGRMTKADAVTLTPATAKFVVNGRTPIIGLNGQPVAEPCDLDADGYVCAVGEEAATLDFNFYNTLSFSSLGIGGTWPSGGSNYDTPGEDGDGSNYNTGNEGY